MLEQQTTSPLSPSNKPSPNWKLQIPARTLIPTARFTAALTSYLHSSQTDDLLIRLVFHPFHNAEPLYIHSSRLNFTACGLIRRLRSDSSSALSDRVIHLARRHHPAVVTQIKQFLYGMTVVLEGWSVEMLGSLIMCAAEWEMGELVTMVCALVVEGEFLGRGEDVVDMATAAGLPSLPGAFRMYYWDCVGRCFDEFRDSEGRAFQARRAAVKEEDVICIVDDNSQELEEVQLLEGEDEKATAEVRICPRFPGLWSMALQQGMVLELISGVVRYSQRQCIKMELMQVVLGFIEGRVKDDEEVCEMIRRIRMTDKELSRVLKREMGAEEFSVRALRLLMRCLMERRAEGMRWRVRWKKRMRVLEGEDSFKKKVEFVPGTGAGVGRFALSKQGTPESGVELAVTWTVDGALGGEMKVGLSVSDECREYHDEVTPILQEVWKGKWSGSNGFSMVFSRKYMAETMKKRGLSGNCAVYIELEVEVNT